MRVELLSYTPDPERTVALAARLCYSPLGIVELNRGLSDGDVERLVGLLRRLGHLSPLEHASFTVGIEGVSRALTHQLVRSRIASYSQQSQRYVEEGQFEFVVPPSVGSREEPNRIYNDAMEAARRAYLGLVAAGVAPEDARFVLGQGFASKLIMTKNARAWLEWFTVRCCARAQWEIRALAQAVLTVLKECSPVLFDRAGPPCVTEGICREGEMSCGRIRRMAPGSTSLLLRPGVQSDDG